MQRRLVKSVQSSLVFLEPCGPAVIAAVLRRLESTDPVARAFFVEGDVRANEKLFATLRQIVTHLDVFSQLERPLMKVGADCLARGVRPPHLASMRRELIAAVAEVSGREWNEDVERGWNLAANATIGAMLRGYAMTTAAAA